MSAAVGRDALRKEFAADLRGEWERAGETTFVVESARIADVCRYLRDTHGFDMLVDMVASHHPEEGLFRVAYWVRNLETFEQFRLRVEVPVLKPEVPSVVDVWPTANFHEREQYDFFGLVFTGHPDLRRIMMPDDFPVHPLRKEFPMEGDDAWRNRVPDTDVAW